MFKWNLCNGFFKFNVEENGSIIDISSWVGNDYQRHFGALQELVDNGMGICTDTEYHIPYRSIYELAEIDREILDIPPIYPFDIYIQTDGIITKSGFKYNYSFRTFAPGGDCLHLKTKEGPVVRLQLGNVDQDYLLTNDEFQLLSAIDEFNAIPNDEKTANGNLLKFSDIVSLGKESSVVLDNVLSNRSVIVPEQIKLSFEINDGVLDIIPKVEGDNEGKFVQEIDRFDEVKDNYRIQKDSSRTYVVINDAQKETISKLKGGLRHVGDKEMIRKIVESPSEYFDLDAVDVSELYSDRVIEMGLYHPKVYPFVSPYKSQWIPTFVVEDRTNGTSTIAIKNYEDLRRLQNAVQESEDTSRNSVDYKGTVLDIGQAKEILNKAKITLDKNESVLGEADKKTHNGDLVLLIKENMEELEFVNTKEPWKQPERLDLFEDEFLNQQYSLKRHQEEGVAWIQCLLNNKLKGCLLADDMGMGKTLQVMYAIDWHSRNMVTNQPYLVVAPVSLLENWKQEYERYFREPRLSILMVTSVPKIVDRTFIDSLAQKQIVLTSYETLRRGQLNFCAVDFAVVVLDEAQKIKTPGAMVTNAAKALKSDFKLAMTGTPVENSFVDLWCIADFAVPGLLGNAREFASKYQNPLKKSNVDIDDLGKQIREQIDGYFMRRMKESIAAELPNKFEKVIKEKMPEKQLQMYKAAINSVSDGVMQGGDMLQFIMRIKALADYPSFGNEVVSHFNGDEIINCSAKMKATFRILDEIKEKHEKVIIFTERKEMQKILQQAIYYKYGLFPRIVNGEMSTTSKKPNVVTRQKAIDNFHSIEGFNVIIMSPVAAGMGLNVAGANHVIHYTRHWNPAKEMQATDRAYRIGQTKDVYVYYPMAIADDFDTFDVTLNDLLNNKKHLASASLYPSEMIEIGKQELFDKLFENHHFEKGRSLTSDDVDSLNDYLFEAYVGMLYEKSGYKVYITPRSGDKGVDVIALGDRENFAIQCKHGKNNVGVSCVQEVQTGAKYYETKYNCSFHPVALINSSFTSNAVDLANEVNVQLIDERKLKQMIESNDISMDEVYRMDNERC